MTVIAFLLFVFSIPMAMALGARHSNPIPALQSLGCLSLVFATAIGVLLRHDVVWLAIELVMVIGLISFSAPMMFGFGAWRTPELIEAMDDSFNRLVEPYVGHPIDVFGWAHAVFDLLPGKLFGVRQIEISEETATSETARSEDQG